MDVVDADVISDVPNKTLAIRGPRRYDLVVTAIRDHQPAARRVSLVALGFCLRTFPMGCLRGFAAWVRGWWRWMLLATATERATAEGKASIGEDKRIAERKLRVLQSLIGGFFLACTVALFWWLAPPLYHHVTIVVMVLALFATGHQWRRPTTEPSDERPPGWDGTLECVRRALVAAGVLKKGTKTTAGQGVWMEAPPERVGVGTQLTIGLEPGVTWRHVLAKAEAVGSGLACDSDFMVVEKGDHDGQARMWVPDHDPYAGHPPRFPLLDADDWNAWEPAPFAVTPHGQVLDMSLIGSNYLGGGKPGCIAAETRIYLPDTDEHVRVDELARRGEAVTVLAWSEQGFVRARTAGAPFVKGTAELFEVQCSDGATLRVTSAHRFLTPQGWRRLADVREGQLLAAAPHVAPASAEVDPFASHAGALRCSGTGAGCPASCSTCRHHGDPRPLLAAAVATGAAPSRSGALVRIPHGWPEDAPGGGPAHSRACRRRSHLTTTGVSLDVRRESEVGPAPCIESAPPSPRSQGSLPSLGRCDRCCSVCAAAPGRSEPGRPGYAAGGSRRSAVSANRAWRKLAATSAGLWPPARSQAAEGSRHPGIAGTALRGELTTSLASVQAYPHTSGWSRIRTIRPAGFEVFYDLTVPGPDNYVAEGLVHHNSGKSFSARPVVAPFILDPDVRFFVFNGKGDAAWEAVRDLSVKYVRGARPEHVWEFHATLTTILEEMDRRYHASTTSKVEEGGEFAPWLLIADEVQEYLGSDEPTTFTARGKKNAPLGKVLDEMLTRLARLGRAAGIIVVMLSQRPDDTVMSLALRSMFGTRFCNRTMSAGTGEIILGVRPGPGTDASKVPTKYKGLGILVPDGEKVRIEGTPLCRPFLVSDDDWADLGKRGYQLRRDAGTAGYLRRTAADAMPLPELLEEILAEVTHHPDDARVPSRVLRAKLAPTMTETAFGLQLGRWGCRPDRDRSDQPKGPRVGDIRAAAQRIREGGRVEVLKSA